MFKVFVDGQEGTTGLQITARLQQHPEVELLEIPAADRKNPAARKDYLNAADVVFLCLPDAAAIEAVALVDSESTRIIDASTAHRVASGWTFGLPELSRAQRDAITNSKRVANPGCHSTGFILLIAPLVTAGLLPPDALLSCSSITGYSGGGKQLIARYEDADDEERALFSAPRPYALSLSHKHQPEMQTLCGLNTAPLFTPVVGPFYKGMIVSIPLHNKQLTASSHASELRDLLAAHYQDSHFVEVRPYDAEGKTDGGFLDPQAMNDSNFNEILVFGDKERMLLVSRLDNLGKGASGAAVQNMNIMLGLPEGMSLE